MDSIRDHTLDSSAQEVRKEFSQDFRNHGEQDSQAVECQMLLNEDWQKYLGGDLRRRGEPDSIPRGETKSQSTYLHSDCRFWIYLIFMVKRQCHAFASTDSRAWKKLLSDRFRSRR